MMPMYVPCPGPPVTVRVTSPITHLCPFEDEVDNGNVTITWRTDGNTLELHSLAEWLTKWEHQEISHEELTATIKAELSEYHGIVADVTVATEWSTAGMLVEVTA